MSTSTLVWTSKTGTPSPSEHAAIVAHIATARIGRGYVVCPRCGIERKIGQGCGEPCA